MSSPQGTPEWADERSADRARLNRKLIRYIGVALVLVALLLTFLVQRQQDVMKRFQQDQCQQRVVNAARATHTWQTLANIERRNLALSPVLRAERVKAYEDAIPVPPDCG